LIYPGQGSATPRNSADGKALALLGVEIINHAPLGVGENIFSDQQVDLIHGHNLIFPVRLIQSQAQSGPASAKAFEDHPQTFFRIVRENLLELLTRGISNFQHACISQMSI
jgi:hypothetical protein